MKRKHQTAQAQKSRVFLAKAMGDSLVLAAFSELNASPSERIVVAGCLPEIIKDLRKRGAAKTKSASDQIVDLLMWRAAGLTPVPTDGKRKFHSASPEGKEKP